MLSRRITALLVPLMLISLSAFAQVNELPQIGLKLIAPWTFIEKGNNYYFNTLSYGVKHARTSSDSPFSISLSKCDIASHRILKSVRIAGDTLQTDSIISYFEQLTCTSGEKLFYLFNQYYQDDTVQHPHPFNSIVFASLDTNLNFLVAPTRLKVQYTPGMARFDACDIQSFTAIGNRLIVGYVSSDSAYVRFSSSTLSRYLILDQQGNILKDSIAGTTPTISATSGVYHRLAEIVPYTNGKLLITGQGLHNNGFDLKKGFVIADSNMNVLDTFAFKADNFLGSNYIGYYPQFPNCVTLPTGSIITGRDFLMVDAMGTQSGPYAAIAKLTLAKRYDADTTIIFKSTDPTNLANSTPSLLNLGYNKLDNRLYYAYTDHRLGGYLRPCTDTLNYVQIVSLDTNLHLKWQKFVSPANHSCSYVSRIAVSENRPGIDVIGFYTDAVDVSDTSLQGYFIYHIDSAGTLAIHDQQAFSIPDRFRVYPNPTSNIVTIDDALQSITSLDVYDMQGQLINHQKAEAGNQQISLANQPPGLYLINLHLKEGTNYAVRVVRQ